MARASISESERMAFQEKNVGGRQAIEGLKIVRHDLGIQGSEFAGRGCRFRRILSRWAHDTYLHIRIKGLVQQALP
jgi:hypothetical protein